jgi:hypothetical protein
MNRDDGFSMTPGDVSPDHSRGPERIGTLNQSTLRRFFDGGLNLVSPVTSRNLRVCSPSLPNPVYSTICWYSCKIEKGRKEGRKERHKSLQGVHGVNELDFRPFHLVESNRTASSSIFMYMSISQSVVSTNSASIHSMPMLTSMAPSNRTASSSISMSMSMSKTSASLSISFVVS